MPVGWVVKRPKRRRPPTFKLLSKLRLPALVCSIEEVSKGAGKSPCGGLAVGKGRQKQN